MFSGIHRWVAVFGDHLSAILSTRAPMWASVILLTVLASGCRSVPKSPWIEVQGPGWTVYHGQAIWRPNRDTPEIAGELWLAVHPDGRSALEFSKPPVTLVIAQRSPERWILAFPAAERTVAGRRKPSSRFAWLHLSSVQQGTPLPAEFVAERHEDGTWRLENKRSGELLSGYFVP